MFLFHRYKDFVFKKIGKPELALESGEHFPIIDIANTASLLTQDILIAKNYKDYIVKPPFEKIWMEFKNSDLNLPEDKSVTEFDTMVYITETPGSGNDFNKLTIRYFIALTKEQQEFLGTNDPTLLRGRISANFDDTGQLIENKDGDYELPIDYSREFRHFLEKVAKARNIDLQEFSDVEESNLVWLFQVVISSITLMHYRNIELIDHPNPKKLGMKSYTPEQRKVYKVINIDPLLKKSRIEYKGGHSNKKVGILKTAFHICRGHYKEYTEDKPMFGNPKLTGKIWIKSHTRGNRDNGEVVKSYKT